MGERCVWTEDPDYGGGPWETSCGELFEFTCDGPKEHRFGFCCWCGKPLEAAYFVPADSPG